MPPLRSTGYLDRMTAAAQGARLAPVPGAGGDQLRALPGPLAVHVPRLLQSRRLPRRRQERPERHDDSARAEDRAPQGRDRSARHEDRGATTRARVTGVTYVTGKEEFFQPAKVVLLSTYTYENSRLLLLSTSKAFPQGPGEQPRPGRAALLLARHRRVGDRALSLQPEQLVRACRRRASPWTTGPTTTSITAGLDFIGGGNLWVYSDRRPIGAANMNTFGTRARLGPAVEGVREGERRPRRTPPTCRRRRCPTRTTTSTSIPVVKDPLGFPVCRITADYKDNERRIADVHPGQDGAVVPRRRRHRHRARPARHDGRQHPRLRRHAHGRQRRDQRREPLRLRRTRCRTSACWARR